MKCPYCGAEIGDNSTECAYCGSKITAEMKAEQEQLNKQGCPKCGSTNVKYTRENHGEVRGKDSKRIIHKTVAVCNDCGNTWEVAEPAPKKRKTWLWVLGWIFIFPVPLTILMLRKKDMKPVLKYGIIAAAWIIYLAIGFGGNSSNKTAAPDTAGTTVVVEETTEKETEKPAETEADKETETEVPAERAENAVRSYEEGDKQAFIELAAGVLKEHLPDSDVPGAADTWTVAKFDNQGAVMAMTAFMLDGKPSEYIYVSTPEFDDSGKIVSNTEHYKEVTGEVFFDDHYCDKVFDTLRQIAGASGNGNNSNDGTEDWTNEQKNAYSSAKQYLQYTAFSRQGLIDQLSSEYGDGYPEDVAEFAVEQLEERGEVDWYEQAEKSARQYLEYSSFSKKELIDQLSSEYGENFTQDQAEKAVEAVYDE